METLHRIIENWLSVEPGDIKSDAKIVDDLGADSLDLITMVMDIEDEYVIEIPDDVAEKWQTVGDVEEYLRDIDR